MIKLLARKKRECKEIRQSIDRRNETQQQAIQRIREVQQMLTTIKQ